MINYQNRQIVVLDLNGIALDSSDTIFQLSELISRNICEVFPLIESIFSDIKALSINDPHIIIDKIRTAKSYLSGIYTYQFYAKIIKGTKRIIWEIYDLTDVYQNEEQHQQTQQIDIINQEIKDHKHKKEQR